MSQCQHRCCVCRYAEMCRSSKKIDFHDGLQHTLKRFAELAAYSLASLMLAGTKRPFMSLTPKGCSFVCYRSDPFIVHARASK
jgi:hypothetical protein